MIHFEEDDRVKWLAFLNTPSGAKGLAFLREHKRPSVRRSGAPHEMHLDLGRQDGFDEALEEVERLARRSEERKLQTADRPGLNPTRRE
jgi:hypothetical protein